MEPTLYTLLLQQCGSLGRAKVWPSRNCLSRISASSDRGSSDATENLISVVFWAANGPKPGAIRGDAAAVVMHASVTTVLAQSNPERVLGNYTQQDEMLRNANSQPLAYVSIDGGNPTIVRIVYQQELDSSNAEITTSPRKYSKC